MNYKTGRRIALIVLVVCVLVSILFGGGRKLEQYRERQLQCFYDGVDGDGLCIYNDLMVRVTSAHNLLSLSERYLKPTDEAVTDLQDAITAMDAAVGVGEYFEANYDLTLASTELYNTMAAQELSEKDERLLSEQFTEMSSRNMTISHDGYNAVAVEFNSLLSAFPTSLIAAVNGVDRLEEFR